MELEGSLARSQEPATVPILNQINPFHTLPPYFPQIHSNIILPTAPRSFEWSLKFRPSDKSFMCIYHLSHACYMFWPSHPT